MPVSRRGSSSSKLVHFVCNDYSFFSSAVPSALYIFISSRYHIMLQCESYAESKGVTWYWVLLNGIFVFGVAFNLFVCYCIVCLSPRLMSSYRWYLLWHQLVTGFTDISVSLKMFYCY